MWAWASDRSDELRRSDDECFVAGVMEQVGLAYLPVDTQSVFYYTSAVAGKLDDQWVQLFGDTAESLAATEEFTGVKADEID